MGNTAAFLSLWLLPSLYCHLCENRVSSMLFLIALKTAAIKVGIAVKQCGVLFLGYLYKATKNPRSRTIQLQGTAAESLVLKHNFLALRVLNTEQTITQFMLKIAIIYFTSNGINQV